MREFVTVSARGTPMVATVAVLLDGGTVVSKKREKVVANFTAEFPSDD
jgi:adenine/guanine phosphoribosyltransferase-like PRPP-binding protein